MSGALVSTVQGAAPWTSFYPVRWAVRLLPWGAAMGAGSALARVHAALGADGLARRVRDGIRSLGGETLSEAEIRRLARGNRATRHEELVETFCYGRLRRRVVAEAVAGIEGTEHRDGALDAGRRAILLYAEAEAL